MFVFQVDNTEPIVCASRQPSLSSLPAQHGICKITVEYGIQQVNLTSDDALTKTKLNSVVFSPQANYTDRATAACWRS
jgi:hypothetical protein